MIIENYETKEQWKMVTIFLTRSEASELRDKLESILDSHVPNDHEHVMSTDFTKEITVVISEEE